MWIRLLEEAGRAVVAMLSLPFFYLAVLLVWVHASRTAAWQRKMHHVRLHRPLAMTLHRTLAGFLAGAAISVVGLSTAFRLDARALTLLWILLAALLLIRPRLARAGVAAALLALGQAVLRQLPVVWPEDPAAPLAWLKGLADALTELDAAGLLLLAGLLHAAEGLMVRWQGARFANPLVVAGKRGKRIGAYELAAVWPVPLLLLVPGDIALPWAPVLGWEPDTAGWAFLAFPVPVGFGVRTFTYWPEDKARFTARLSFWYGVVVAAVALAAALLQTRLPAVAGIAAVLALLLHEAAFRWNRWREQGRRLLYVHDGRGLTILAVQPGTAAEAMGLQAGEVVRQANGVPVHNLAELHAALERQPAYTRLEVLNREGQIKFAQRARYASERHLLGLVPAPEGKEPYAVPYRPLGLWQWLTGAGLPGVRRRDVGGMAALEGTSLEEARGDAAAEVSAARNGDGAGGEAAAGTTDAAEAADAANAANAGVSAADKATAGDIPSAGEPAGLPPRRARKRTPDASS